MSGRRRETRAERNIRWIEDHLFVPDGKLIGKPLKVAPFMRDDFKAIYDNAVGTRLAIISRGRKNAKTTEAAMLALLHLCGPEFLLNSQIHSTGQSLEQAAIVFGVCARMVRMSPVLSSFVTIKDHVKELVCAELGTRYKALSAEVKTAFGLNPAVTIHDELGQVRGPRSELYEALETATAAQANPLTVVISTQAPNDADLLSVLIDDALGGHDPRIVLRLNTAGPEFDDPFDIAAIAAANPALRLFMNEREVLAMAENARRMPSRQAEYENLVLNRRVEASNPFVSPVLWKACGAPTKDIRGVPVYGGLDLSEVRDLTALVLIGLIDGVWQVKPTFWLPGEGLVEKARADRVPYDLWRERGWLRTTPGKTVSYEFVAHHLRTVFEQHKIEKLAFDRWNLRHLKPWLLKAGFREHQIEGEAAQFEQFGQGYQSMSPALRDLEALILDQQIAHGNHPVLTMCAANAVIETDGTNRKLSKKKAHGRIDGMQALAMAIGVAPLQAKPVSIEALIA